MSYEVFPSKRIQISLYDHSTSAGNRYSGMFTAYFTCHDPFGQLIHVWDDIITCRPADLIPDEGCLILNGKERLLTDAAVLAVGHSARDTFQMLCERGLEMEAKMDCSSETLPPDSGVGWSG